MNPCYNVFMDTNHSNTPQGTAHAQSDEADPHERWARRVCPRDQDGNRIGEPMSLADTRILKKPDGGLVVGR